MYIASINEKSARIFADTSTDTRDAFPDTKSKGLPPPPGGCVCRASGSFVDDDVIGVVLVVGNCASVLVSCGLGVVDVVVILGGKVEELLISSSLVDVLVGVGVLEVVDVDSDVVVDAVAGGGSSGIREKLRGGGKLIDVVAGGGGGGGCLFPQRAITSWPFSAWFNSDAAPTLAEPHEA